MDTNQEFQPEQCELDSLGFPVDHEQNRHSEGDMGESENLEQCELDSLGFPVDHEQSGHSERPMVEREKVKEELEQLSIALQQEQVKAGCQQVALQSYADEVSVLTQELLIQKENNLQLQNHVIHLEQEKLKVVAQLKMFQSRKQVLEKRYESTSSELQALQQTNEELKQKLEALTAEQQKNKFPQDQYEQKRNDQEIMELLENIAGTQELLISNHQELFCQKQDILELRGQIKHLEQEHLKVADQMKVAQSRMEQIEKRDDSRISELRTEELEQQLQMVSAQLQNEKKSVILQKQQEESAALRAQISVLETELEKHKVQWEDKSHILNEHEEELASIRARMSVMDDEIKDLKQVMVATRELQKTKEHQMEGQDTEMADELITQEDKGVCQGIIERLRNELRCSQQKCETLKIDLIQTLNELGTQRSKFYKRELRYKDKLSKAKAMYLRETAWRDDKIKDLEKELHVLTLQLEK